MVTIPAGTHSLQDFLDAASLQALITSLRAGEYNLYLGAGTSLDATNAKGDALLSGDAMRSLLCTLTGSRPSSSMQRVFAALSPTQVQEHVTDCFANCTHGPSVARLPSFIWRRIFTLNIDDVLESAYTDAGRLQEIRSFHFRDPYEDLRTLTCVPIIHLHGWARQPDRGYVFARSEYARLMTDANAWMTVLADIMPIEPFMISGTNLDEIDLEFYLARRSAMSPREDRGPSFFVEPHPDAQTANDCTRYALHLYHGKFQEFLLDIDSLAPGRATPYELVTTETRALFPSGAPVNTVLSFANDFDLVPRNIPAVGKGIKFSYGNPPDWNDLASNWDVGRSLVPRVRAIIDAMIAGTIPERILVISERTGFGKTTALRRVAYDLSTSGSIVLECSALSRVDPRSTAEALDYIDEPVIIIIDNFGAQCTAISAAIRLLENPRVVFLGAERSYRQRHVVRALGDIPYRLINGLELNSKEAEQLVSGYVQRGLTPSREAVVAPSAFAERVLQEPIAVACCLILNDMRPLDSIIESTYIEATADEQNRYLMAALAQFCFSGGIRFEILAGATGRGNWNSQFQPDHPLPLDYFDPGRRNFVIPLNAMLAQRTLERSPVNSVARAFESLASRIAPRVNRDAIRRRTPEARLAGRLFDYDDVIHRFLAEEAGCFYAKVQPAWQWNSRYWEQVALYHLSRFRMEQDELLLQQALQHARHAVSIEQHPFPLTTLGKVLLAQIGLSGISSSSAFSEALAVLLKAIEIEHRRGRASVHAYVTLFRGVLDYVDLGCKLSKTEQRSIEDLIKGATKYFPGDKELREITERVSSTI